MSKSLSFVVNFDQVDKNDIGLVGGKGANLGELTRAGFPVPSGFIITAKAYYEVVKVNQLQPKIQAILAKVNLQDIKSLNKISAQIKKIILRASIPETISQEIIKRYLTLNRGLKQTLVAVRSSATAEDLPDASFAGQQETYLNIKGEANLIQAVRSCWASLFEPRAIFYRQEKGFDHFKIGIAVPVQTMVQSEVSGIMFTINPVTNDKNQIVIEAIWGLGEMIVQGRYTPDHYLVQKLSWKILQKQVNFQKKALVLSANSNQEINLPLSKIKRAKLLDEQILAVAKLGHKVQQHYFFPQDIEWAFYKNKLYLVQSRPVTTLKNAVIQKAPDLSRLKLILKGEGTSPGIVSGYVRVLQSAKEINQLQPQEILVTDMTTPDFVPAMKKARAIITNKGGQTSHAAIVSRELGIPCVVGTETATKILTTGKVVTVNGSTGQVFLGGNTAQPTTIESPIAPVKINPQSFVPDFLTTATKVYVNLGEPDLAGSVAQKNVDGVGLLRAEFMIAQIGIHPRKLIADKRSDFFVAKIVEGLTKFAKAFYPRPVIYRATDFKTNEYANLVGGKAFEPVEANPMIGYRGAFRYIHDQKVFELELKALKQVRNQLGYKNLHLMLPFVRTVKELTDVKKIISNHGLIRSTNFKLWMMVEIPSNVILLEEFIKAGIDGVSIGSNDLTMLILGVDRDSSEVAPAYDELNPAVMWAFEKTVTTCQQHHITCSMCGQAPSIYPDLTQKLVKWGITSVSISPDVIDQTRNIIYEAEKHLIHVQNR